ncbi:putative RNA-binding Zn ribbon-like protein [Stackebrandtia albiflava]|uniref:Putative RNA-binding Zn ribbon-like protein n=1 Tax=Stackebrandtia albiflava TaxID=406432 RepID=A0A562VAA5_9ACTN|nr:CGNR zinc finger domain-containing protein [Stackebrandtia albiflava]TWJ14830.1 putative RNA-binding Zn ribbon-like protein [Stackebrandtia albiflava]
MTEDLLAMALAGTVHGDGAGGVTDDLVDLAGLDRWLARWCPGLTADATALHRVRRSRRAVRLLLSEATGAPATRVDDDGSPVDSAWARQVLNADAARVARIHRLEVDGDRLVLRDDWTAGSALDRFAAGLAASAMGLLTGPERDRIRACAAPRCVRYFLASHGRQAFCKPACSNRARAARHYRRHRSPSPDRP